MATEICFQPSRTSRPSSVLSLDFGSSRTNHKLCLRSFHSEHLNFQERLKLCLLFVLNFHKVSSVCTLQIFHVSVDVSHQTKIHFLRFQEKSFFEFAFGEGFKFPSSCVVFSHSYFSQWSKPWIEPSSYLCLLSWLLLLTRRLKYCTAGNAAIPT